MSNLAKGLVLVAIILAIGAGLVVWKKKVGGGASDSFNSISKQEIELLLADVAKKNPMALKRLADDPELKKTQIENLTQLMAFASEAKKEGYADEENNKRELQNIRSEITAMNYDQEINKDKGPMPPFGFITEDQIKAFWDADHDKKEAAFQEFLDTKIKLLKASNPQMADREISDEEKEQAREFYAKVQIYAKEAEDKMNSGALSEEFKNRLNLQIKLQQAQFLARIFSEKVAEKVKATDDDIAKYIAEHPELDPKDKKAKAQEILDRAKNGEDFAAMANEFSQDPGNKNEKGEPKGGLYTDVQKGRMVKPFEEAALALEPGQITPNLVETDYGYHIIKLEKKADSKDSSGNPSQTYDVRHILISTGYKDPENPMGREVPVKEYVRQKLEKEKQKKFINEIVASNNVQVAEDFEIPKITDEQIQEMQKQQQQQMGPGGMPPGADVDDETGSDTKKSKSDAKKPEAKKK